MVLINSFLNPILPIEVGKFVSDKGLAICVNYSATVDYNNPETGYSATYTLDVEVQDCQVVQINFPNDGYLDEDHISYADIDEDGRASVDGEDGKTYEIQIDN